MKFKKAILALTAISAVAAPVATVVACGEKTETVKYVKSTWVKGSQEKVYGVTDGGKQYDGAFNYQSFEAVLGFSGRLNNFMVSETDSKQDILKQYNNALKIGADTIVCAGYRHLPALEVASSQNPNKAFILADAVLNVPTSEADSKTLVRQGNVISIQYKSGQAGFLAGFHAAVYAADHKNADGGTKGEAKVATFGAMDIPPINFYMEGFKKGVEKFNEKNPSKKVELVTAAKGESDFIGTFGFDPERKVTNKTNELLSKGVDVIFPVGGEQEFTVMEAMWDNDKAHNAKIIGVDNDMSILKQTTHKELVLGSAIKKVDLSVTDVLENLYENPNAPKLEEELTGESVTGKDLFGKTLIGSLGNGWVGFVMGPSTDPLDDEINKFAAEQVNVRMEHNFH